MPVDRYRSFRNTPLGRRLVALAEDDARIPEYRAFSRVGMPAVTALVYELNRDFPDAGIDNFAKQALGAFVGNVMRKHGHREVRRGRVPGGFFSYGAVWSPEDCGVS